MRRIALFAPLLLAGCGYIGDPLPPALRIPQPVADLTARQIGPDIEIRFTLPDLTNEGLPLAPGAAEVKIGEAPAPPFSLPAWEGRATPIQVPWPAAALKSVTHRFPAAAWAGRNAVLGVRLSSPKGRYSSYSNLAALRVIEPLTPPSPVTAEGRAEGIRLTWPARPGTTYRIFRGSDFLAESPQGVYLDQFIDYGKTYSYQVVAAVNQGDTRAESLPSAAAAVDYQDRFPPAAPTGLTAIAGVNSIEVAWDRNTEPDLAGYRVYRAEGEGSLAPLGDPVTAPSYSDRAAAKGKTYRYAVTALDRNGNESARQPEAVTVENP